MKVGTSRCPGSLRLLVCLEVVGWSSPFGKDSRLPVAFGWRGAPRSWAVSWARCFLAQAWSHLPSRTGDGNPKCGSSMKQGCRRFGGESP